MLKRSNHKTFIVGLLIVLVLGSCRNSNLPWRPGTLVTQMYRQYKQEILLGYNDFQQNMVVDDQHGFARAYFDNYRNQIIFTTQWSLDYMIGNKQMTTETEDISGYIYKVLFNEMYQLGVEMLDINTSDLGQDEFDGARIRINDLNSDKSVIIAGFPSNIMLSGQYVYCNNYDKNDNRYLDIINVETMEHTRLATNDKAFTFFYQMGDKTFAQVGKEKRTFLIENNHLIEQTNPLYKTYPVIDEHVGYVMLKDIAPIDNNEHWYINPLKQYHVTYWAEVLKFEPNKVERVFIDFDRDDILQIVDGANYGNAHVAILYETRVSRDDPIREYIDIYDMTGKLTERREVTELAGGKSGRFTALDYVA